MSNQPPKHCSKKLLSNALPAAVNYQARNDKVDHQNYQLKLLTLASAGYNFNTSRKLRLQGLPLRILENENL